MEVPKPIFSRGKKRRAAALIKFSKPIPSEPINLGNRYTLLKAPTANPK
jgi:hypothetical protein